ncbi:MAG: DNA-3-methyladenine glycosylase family protein [Anaerovoracaceae bacterium]
MQDFDLKETFECGQCFRWREQEDGSYIAVLQKELLELKPNGQMKFLLNGEEDIYISDLNHGERFLKQREDSIFQKRSDLYEYFDLARDYSKIKSKLSVNDDIMKTAIAAGSGIRILCQDPWETLISFIISQNNHIPRIKGCIDALCENFGDYLTEYKGKKYFAFPTPEQLLEGKRNEPMTNMGNTRKKQQCDLSVCKLGYRDKYIIKTAELMTLRWEDTVKIKTRRGKGKDDYLGEDFEGLTNYEILYKMRDEDIDSDTAYKFLLSLPGVGPKVADCILLFGLKKADRFPIDVWVKRLMQKLYGFAEEDTKGMQEFAKREFGENAGIAQQYLFHYIRKLGNRE